MMKILLTEEERMIKNMFRTIMQENHQEQADISWDTLIATGAFEMTLPAYLDGEDLEFGVEILLAELLGEHAASTLFFDSIFGFELLEAHYQTETPRELIGKKIGIVPADSLRMKVNKSTVDVAGTSEYIAFADQADYFLFIDATQYVVLKTSDLNPASYKFVQNKYMGEAYCYDLVLHTGSLPIFLAGQLDVNIYHHHMMKALLRYCAYFTGACERMIYTTIHYTAQRQQFGKPIIQFQTISHRLAALKAETIALNKLVIHAAFNVNEDELLWRNIKSLFQMTQQQAHKTVKECMQFHGAYGMTAQSIISLFYRRMMVNSLLWSKLPLQILERSYVI
ncbi:acyl-CoA dehydrogenase [Paenibacillus campi]|uniref:acyl-CoA dehydrogenase n=1 Tax=Paenibacillus campi TaxID=3106031 RepID=UPI002AFE1531|nr:acyl-CoA dehydrogenase [Paenibacillus sp. SGZ-1014]